MLDIKKMLKNILKQMTVTEPTASITATTGSLLRVETIKCGRIVTMRLTVYNNQTVNSGANLFAGKLQTTSLLPSVAATGCGFFGARSINANMETDGSIVVRNASAVTMATSSSDTVGITLTYISKSGGGTA